MHLLGYVTIAGERRQSIGLQDRQKVITFLAAHRFDGEVALTDAEDRLIFRAVDGVDLNSRLDEFGIDLPALYRKLRRVAIEAEIEPADQREPPEDHYDSGLSPAEIRMRQKAKRLAKAARTVADVVELLAGTYFAARFENEDRTRSWGSFHPDDLSVIEVIPESAESDRIRLSPEARVRHDGSGEDVHGFVLLDPPDRG